jgi:cysteinyl-tRNA synthetase
LSTTASQVSRRDQLAAVSHWFYFLSFDLENEGPVYEQLTASSYDMVVMEPIFTEENSADEEQEVQDLVTGFHNAAHPKLVLAYIDIGQAEDFRTYWQDAWEIGDPEWIVGADPDGWEGNYPVAYWYDEWQQIWLSETGYLQSILDAGFDGVYLDWVEAYTDENVVAKAISDGVDAQQEMLWWVEDIANFGRAQQPDFIVIAQNAAELGADDDYVAIIDAIAQEQTWFDGAADNDPPGDCPLPATDDDIDTEEYEQKLKDADLKCYQLYLDYPDSTLHVSSESYINALTVAYNKGETIFTVDYALKFKNVAWVYKTSRELGFVPFASERHLSIYRDPLLLHFTYLPIILR